MSYSAVSASFEYLCYESAATINSFPLTVRWSTLDVRIWRLKSSPALWGVIGQRLTIIPGPRSLFRFGKIQDLFYGIISLVYVSLTCFRGETHFVSLAFFRGETRRADCSKMLIDRGRPGGIWCWLVRQKWNESGFRPPLCTYRLNWARRTSCGWWDDWDDTVLQTQDSKFEPWRSEAEHATSRSRRLPTIPTFTRGWRRNNFVSFKPPRPGWSALQTSEHNTLKQCCLLLGQRRGGWTSIKPALDKLLVLVGQAPDQRKPYLKTKLD